MGNGAGKKLWGWYPAGNVWVPIQVDANGKPVVDMSAIKLDDLGDVAVPTPGDQYLLYWDAVTSLWKCRALVDSDIPTPTLKSLLTAQGDIITRDASAPKRLAKGTQNFFLRMGASEPEWVRGYEWGPALTPWQFENYFGNWTTTLTGSGSVVAKDYGLLELATGTTAGSTARGRGMRFGWQSWTYPIEWYFVSNLRAVGTVTGYVWWKWGGQDTAADPTNQCVGWRLDGYDLKGIVHDGTTLTVVNLNFLWNTYEAHGLFLKFVPGDQVYWYVDGVLKGSSSAIPSTTRMSTAYIVFALTNSAVAQNTQMQLNRQGWISSNTG